MKKISFWAKAHVLQARLLIIISFSLLTCLGIITGVLLKDTGATFSPGTILAVVLLYVAGLVAYPSKATKRKKKNSVFFYRRQKTCDYLLAASTFCMIVFVSNRPGILFNYSSAVNATVPAMVELPKDSTVKAYKSIAAFNSSMKDANGNMLKWKEKKKLLKEQIRAIKKDSDMSKGSKTGLIILCVLVALGLLYLVAALACSLSCNGSEGAAILVTIGGAGLIALLLVVTIRAILGKKKKPKQAEKDTGDAPTNG